ncbi:hypothetical protein PIB30_045453 [Stylosanthes scabra]|uniref:Uncharacterized protein n=1 Tax=Stylosanthes scabra TaxID=79078 RepID=A0ABU6TFV0_9FABA|nr:hypothetical protein [Stylosanthes scabra]
MINEHAFVAWHHSHLSDDLRVGSEVGWNNPGYCDDAWAEDVGVNIGVEGVAIAQATTSGLGCDWSNDKALEDCNSVSEEPSHIPINQDALSALNQSSGRGTTAGLQEENKGLLVFLSDEDSISEDEDSLVEAIAAKEIWGKWGLFFESSDKEEVREKLRKLKGRRGQI